MVFVLVDPPHILRRGGEPSPPDLASHVPDTSFKGPGLFFLVQWRKKKGMIIFELVNSCKEILRILSLLVYGWPAGHRILPYSE